MHRAPAAEANAVSLPTRETGSHPSEKQVWALRKDQISTQNFLAMGEGEKGKQLSL